MSQLCKVDNGRLLSSAASDMITYPSNLMMRRGSLNVFAHSDDEVTRHYCSIIND